MRMNSPLDNSVMRGNLCIKGRFGWQFTQTREVGALDLADLATEALSLSSLFTHYPTLRDWESFHSNLPGIKRFAYRFSGVKGLVQRNPVRPESWA